MRRLLFATALLLCSLALWSYDFQSGDLCYSILQDKTNEVAVISNLSAPYTFSSINIPASVSYNGTTYSVTSIGNEAFLSRRRLTSITIPNSVTSIGSSAFSHCSSLTSVTIPNSVASIGWYTFSDCSSLTSVTIPNSVTSIGDYAFSDCSSLTFITIPNRVTSIGRSTFARCTSLTSVTIPNSVTSIGDYAFSDCSSLTSVTIPNSVTSIGDYAFDGCSSLTSITIPNSVTSIGHFAFDGCSSLTSITIPNSVTGIGRSAFSGCSGLTSITIPNSVTNIGLSPFIGCSSLTSIDVMTTNLNYCSLNGVLFNKDMTTLLQYPVGKQASSHTIPNGVTSIEESAFDGCSSLTSITIPNSVTSIGWCAFRGCNSLTSVTIPNSVTSIGGGAFCGCSSLTSITISNSVTSIGYEAFYGCSSLTSITISNSVTSIGYGTFYGCSSLTSVTIPNSVTSIGSDAFLGCSSLTSVTCEAMTPPTLKKNTFHIFSELCVLRVPYKAISTYQNSEWAQYFPSIEAFDAHKVSFLDKDGNCIVVQEVEKGSAATAPEAPEVEGYHFIGWDVDFSNVTSDMTVTAQYAINTYRVTFCDAAGVVLAEQIVEHGLAADTMSSVTDRFGYTFSGYDQDFSHVTADMTITVQYTRDEVEGLYYIYDREELTAALDHEGNSYARMTSLAVPATVTYRGMTFAVTAVADSAFAGCDRLTDLVTSNTLETIGEGAFAGCSDIAHITLGTGMRDIRDNAFAGCKRIEDITVYAERVIDLTALSFANIGNKSYVPVYVPEPRLRFYQRDEYWSEFDLQVKSAERVEDIAVNNVQVEPEETTAVMTWPEVTNADSYDLDVRDNNGDIFCSLIFDGEGHLIGINFGMSHAPAMRAERVHMTPAATDGAQTPAFGSVNGFRFMVTGLDEGSHYSLRLTAKDASELTLDMFSATFTTKGTAPSDRPEDPEGVEDVQRDDVQCTKVLRDGVLYILRDGKTFTTQGQLLR